MYSHATMDRGVVFPKSLHMLVNLLPKKITEVNQNWCIQVNLRCVCGIYYYRLKDSQRNSMKPNESPPLVIKDTVGMVTKLLAYWGKSQKDRSAAALLRARFHGRLELDMRVQPALQHALLEYRLCRDWRDWRLNWISFSTQPIACLHGNKVTAFLFCPPFCPRFPPVQASHGNAL
jgi:hypothetical protein